MQTILDYLLGVIRPIDPRQWRGTIRGSRAMEGWAPPMMLIATMMCLVLARQGFGLLGGNAAAIACLIAACAMGILMITVANRVSKKELDSQSMAPHLSGASGGGLGRVCPSSPKHLDLDARDTE